MAGTAGGIAGVVGAQPAEGVFSSAEQVGKDPADRKQQPDGAGEHDGHGREEAGIIARGFAGVADRLPEGRERAARDEEGSAVGVARPGKEQRGEQQEEDEQPGEERRDHRAGDAVDGAKVLPGGGEEREDRASANKDGRADAPAAEGREEPLHLGAGGREETALGRAGGTLRLAQGVQAGEAGGDAAGVAPDDVPGDEAGHEGGERPGRAKAPGQREPAGAFAVEQFQGADSQAVSRGELGGPGEGRRSEPGGDARFEGSITGKGSERLLRNVVGADGEEAAGRVELAGQLVEQGARGAAARWFGGSHGGGVYGGGRGGDTGPRAGGPGFARRAGGELTIRNYVQLTGGGCHSGISPIVGGQPPE